MPTKALICVNEAHFLIDQDRLPAWTYSMSKSARTADDQSEVIAFLSRGDSYGRPGAEVLHLETHASIVFLVADRAYKLKRAVRFSFLDYSTIALRERFCRAELSLNRRTSAGIYLAVRAITRGAKGALEFDGSGEVLDWIVEMRRFAQESLFDHLAREHRLTPALMVRLADAIARFHDIAEVVSTQSGSAAIEAVINDNHAVLAGGDLPRQRPSIDALRAASLAELRPIGKLLDARVTGGKVRRCHGDLHLRNICLLEGEPTLFDAIEFSDELACIDVLYDLAFLLMDLCHRTQDDLANAVFNRYLDRSGDVEGLRVLPLFMSVRAGVRAKVAVLSGGGAAGEAAAYVALGLELLRRQPPRLIAVGGPSGSGKSTLAAALAPAFRPAPGARVIRSDVLRKLLMKVAPEERLPEDAYDASTSDRVYVAMADQASRALAAGSPVIVDATFLRASERDAISAVARQAGVPFTGLWLTGPESVLAERLSRRHGDASDADAGVLHHQLGLDTGPISWHRIDVAGALSAALASARRLIAAS